MKKTDSNTVKWLASNRFTIENLNIRLLYTSATSKIKLKKLPQCLKNPTQLFFKHHTTHDCSCGTTDLQTHVFTSNSDPKNSRGLITALLLLAVIQIKTRKKN